MISILPGSRPASIEPSRTRAVISFTFAGVAILMNTPSEILPKFRHLRPQAREINWQVWMARFPRELKTLAGLINLAVVLDALAGGDFADNLNILARALQWPIEHAAMPTGDGLVCHTKSQQQAPAGKILQRRGLNSQRHRAASVDMVDRRAELDGFCPARNRRKHDHWVRAVGFAFPKCAKSHLFGQHDQARHIGRRIVRRRVYLNIIDHHLSSSSTLND